MGGSFEPPKFLELAAARAAKKDNSYDNEPYPVVVKKIAKAVVIHDKSILSKICDQAFCLLDIIICYF